MNSEQSLTKQKQTHKATKEKCQHSKYTTFPYLNTFMLKILRQPEDFLIFVELNRKKEQN